MWVPQVSVVLPLFGDHRAAATVPAVCRAWLAQDVPCEVVIAAAAGTAVPEIADERVRIVTASPGPPAPGPLRNLAAAASRAPVLYLGDADIVPLGAGFLTRALAVADGGVVIQPWMYRLTEGNEATGTFEPPGRGRLCYVTADAEGRLTPVGGERFTWLSPEMIEVEPPPDLAWRRPDGTTWPAWPFHWGGILVPRSTFDEVAGYCTRYVGWGCEDDDLIAKLQSHGPVIRAWRAARQLTCLHFEHPRAHTAVDIEANRAILTARLAAGGAAMIDEDRTAGAGIPR